MGFTRISIPDGGSIAISAPRLLDERFWTIEPARITLTRNIEVLGLGKIEIFPSTGKFQWHAPFPAHDRRLTYGWCSEPKPAPRDFPRLVVDIETGLGTIQVQASERSLSLSLVGQQLPDASFDQWRREEGNKRSKSPYQALHYVDRAEATKVLIDRVFVNGALIFERTRNKARVDIWFATAEKNPFEGSGWGTGTKQATARRAATAKRPGAAKNR